MIRPEEIWDEIEKQGLGGYVRRYEVWLKPGELKEFLSKHKIIKKSVSVGVYIIIFLYFLAFLVGFGYVYQGFTEARGDRDIVGFIIIFIGAAALYVWISNSFTAMDYLLDSGVIVGISNKKIRALYKYTFSYIPYKYIDNVSLENFRSEVKRIVITTKDGKIWGSSPKYERGNFLVNAKKTDEYLSLILKGIEAVKYDSEK